MEKIESAELDGATKAHVRMQVQPAMAEMPNARDRGRKDAEQRRVPRELQAEDGAALAGRTPRLGAAGGRGKELHDWNPS